MKNDGHGWVRMGTDGFRWEGMGTEEHRWVQMDFDGLRWAQMGSDGLVDERGCTVDEGGCGWGWGPKQMEEGWGQAREGC